MEGNVWRPAHLTPEQIEERRLVAAVLLRQGRFSQAEIARQLGVSRASVCRWAATLAQQGRRGLAARAKTGRSPRLDETAWTRLGRLLDRGAVAAGFATERWTLKRIAAVIEREFGVRYHPRYLERPLKAHGFSVQRPATRAKERDELVIAVWPKREWIALKRKRSGSTARFSSGMRPATASGLGPAAAAGQQATGGLECGGDHARWAALRSSLSHQRLK
jgi:transposase